MSFGASFRRGLEALGSGSAWRLVAPLTTLYVLIYLVAQVLPALRVPWVQGGLTAAAGAALIWPTAARQPWVWWSMVGLMACAMASSWMLVDNHVFLASYWLVAIAAAGSAPRDRRARTLAKAASSLIGLTMAFATIHKLRTPAYLAGDFFHLTFLTEARFAPLSWLAGVDLGQLSQANAERLAALQSDPSQGAVALATGGQEIHDLAVASSWLVLALELSLAVLWLFRVETRVMRRVRHGALLFFALGTYTVAPVPGFGAILVILGLADTRPGDGALRLGYLAALLHVLFSARVIGMVLT